VTINVSLEAFVDLSPPPRLVHHQTMIPR
jgi:hypothetical protein